MKNLAIILVIAVLLLGAGILGIVAQRQSIALRESRQQIQALQAKLDVVLKSANLDLQAKCAEQAAATWKSGGWDKLKNATYSNHYNSAMNKCFMRVENSIPDRSGAVFASDRIVEAYEGKVYGELTWRLDEAGNAMRCNATLPTGEQVQCTSPQEFDSLAEQFMN
jgi:Sec-independent protein translocase protein TatA